MKPRPRRMSLLESVRTAQFAIELIGYLEDANQLAAAERQPIIVEIQMRLAELGRFKPRIFAKPKRIRNMAQLYSRAGSAQTECRNSDLDMEPTPGTYIKKTPKPERVSAKG